jgi:hypothetical protein
MLLPASKLHGQSALFSAVSVDQLIQNNTNLETQLPPEGHHWGPVPYSIGVYANATYNDNINETQNNPEWDVILGAGVNVGLSWAPTGQSALQFGAGIGYLRYLRNVSSSGLNITPNSALSYTFSLDDVSVTLFDQFSYFREVTTEASLANIGTLPRFDNTIGARVAWNPDQWTFQAGYSHDNYLSDGGGINDNRSSEYFFGRAGWRFAEKTEAGVEASYTVTSYDVLTQDNSSSVSVGAYANWQVRPSLNLTIRGGPVFNMFPTASVNGGNSQLFTYYIDFQANQQLTEYLSHQLSINHSIQPGLTGNTAYVEELDLTYSIFWALTQRIRLGASFLYQDGSQPVPFVSPGSAIQSIEDYDRYGAEPQILWQCTDKLSASLTYNYWLRQSNLEGSNYRQNTLTAGLSYTF